MHPFTAAFLAALLVATAARCWLAVRHVRHVASRRNAVPREFADRIPLESHQKAADYTVAKTRLSIAEALVGAVMTLAFTFGGGLDALAAAAAHFFDSQGYTCGIALILSVALVAGIVDLPFSLYRTFRIEARFGFNRMTFRLWLIDLVKGLVLALVIGVPLLFAVLWLMGRWATPGGCTSG